MDDGARHHPTIGLHHPTWWDDAGEQFLFILGVSWWDDRERQGSLSGMMVGPAGPSASIIPLGGMMGRARPPIIPPLSRSMQLLMEPTIKTRHL